MSRIRLRVPLSVGRVPAIGPGILGELGWHFYLLVGKLPDALSQAAPPAAVNQPGAPRVLRGRDEVAEWIADVCGRDMSHHVEHAVADADGAAFSESCRYPDGTNVLCATVMELQDGQIARQTVVQPWDEV